MATAPGMPNVPLHFCKLSLPEALDSDFSQVDFKAKFKPIEVGSVTKLLATKKESLRQTIVINL